ncbi:MAG: YidB family protein [Synechococcus sp.]
MALFDTLVSGVLSAVAGDKAPVLQDFLNANGGVTGLADKFQKGGANEVFASWVSTGANQTITPQQIEAVLGHEKVKEMAARLGIDPAQASDFLARTLPGLVDQLTPQGQMS